MLRIKLSDIYFTITYSTNIDAYLEGESEKDSGIFFRARIISGFQQLPGGQIQGYRDGGYKPMTGTPSTIAAQV